MGREFPFVLSFKSSLAWPLLRLPGRCRVKNRVRPLREHKSSFMALCEAAARSEAVRLSPDHPRLECQSRFLQRFEQKGIEWGKASGFVTSRSNLQEQSA